MQLTAVFEEVPEGYIGFVEELPGANTQGATLAEARANLSEAVEMVLEANRALAEESMLGHTVIREALLLLPQSNASTSSGISKDTDVSYFEKAVAIRFT